MSETVDFEAVVIGSGFGGTIAALTLGNYFTSKSQQQPSSPVKKVCVIERGQWWISHEIPYRTQAERGLETPNPPTNNMREYLQDNNQPFNYWAHPDNAEGLVNWASKNRLLNKTGLYDYRLLSDDVHAVVASGVGGGSLVYSNVTLEPPPSVYQNQWPGEHVPGPSQNPNPNSVSNFFPRARAIIGTNRITTIAGLGPKTVKLDKSRVFQEAAHKTRSNPDAFTITNPYDPKAHKPDPDLGFALDLSITDVAPDAFVGANNKGVVTLTPDLEQEVLKDSVQNNVCQRQGRCVLGCLPGSRHTLNKKLVTQLQKQTSEILTVNALTEATSIELTESGNYKVSFTRYNTDGKPSSHPDSKVTRVLVLAAGTLGTTELLLKSPSLPVSKRLGEGFSTDGDLLGFMKLTGKGPVTSVDNTRGPINTSHALFNNGKEFRFSIEDTTIPKMVAPLFATMLELYLAAGLKQGFLSRLKLIWHFHLTGLIVAIIGFDIPRFQRIVTHLWGKKKIRDLLLSLVKPAKPQNPQTTPDQATNIAAGLLDALTKDHTNPNASPDERLSKYLIFSCMGMDKANGTLFIRKNKRPNHPEEQLELEWDPEDNRQIFDDIIKGMNQLARQIDPKAIVHAPTWEPDPKKQSAPDLFSLLHPLAGIHTHKHKDKRRNRGGPSEKKRSLVVLHPLGGCRMADSIKHGVVNMFGQVYNPNISEGLYDNLYALDGSIVPSALGVNSSLTIAALALRGVKNLVEKLEKEYAQEAGQPTPAGFDGSKFWP